MKFCVESTAGPYDAALLGGGLICRWKKHAPATTKGRIGRRKWKTKRKKKKRQNEKKKRKKHRKNRKKR